MPNLIEELEQQDSQGPDVLRTVKLGKEPTALILFTGEFEPATLHFEGDEAVWSYIPCPGGGCPICFLGSAPQQFYLLPVFNVESRQVEVLRISSHRGPDSLSGGLKPHLKDPQIAEKIFLVSRLFKRFKIEVRPLAENADRGAQVILAFKTAWEGGLKLIDAFPKMSPSEIAEVERVRRKLDAIGGWTPPAESTLSTGAKLG